jgi:acyl-CoA thioesterase FadM
MSKIFTRQFRVRWSEVNASKRVSAAKYMEYLVDTAYDWGAANSLGFEESRTYGLVWVILETDIRFLHPLRYNDEFDFTIWMVEWRKVRGTRAFELRLKDSDAIVAQGMQQVVSLDGDLRPKAPAEDLIDRFRLDKPRSFSRSASQKLEAAPPVAFAFNAVLNGGT